VPSLDGLEPLYKKIRKPMSATFEITSSCNFRCAHCYLGERKADTRTAKVEEWLELSKILRRMGVVWVEITGGEPLLYPGLKKLLKFLLNYFMVGLITNLSLIGERDALLLSKLTYVRGSVYGSAGRLGMEVWRSAKKLLSMGANLSVGYQANRENIHEYPRVRQDFKRIGLKLGVNYHYMNTVYNRQAQNQMPSPEQVAKYISPNLKYEEGKAKRCHIQTTIAVRSDLTFTPCLLFPYNQGVPLNENKILEYYVKEAYVYYEIRELKSPCDGCPYQACREKHCYAHNITQAGKPYFKDPFYCEYYSKLYKIMEERRKLRGTP